MGLKFIGGFPVVTPDDDQPEPSSPLPPLVTAAIIVFFLAVMVFGAYVVFHPHK